MEYRNNSHNYTTERSYDTWLQINSRYNLDCTTKCLIVTRYKALKKKKKNLSPIATNRTITTLTERFAKWSRDTASSLQLAEVTKWVGTKYDYPVTVVVRSTGNNVNASSER